MPSSEFPERSYWVGEWTFPKTGSAVTLALQAGESGPKPEVREFYRSLPGRFEQIVVLCRPGLEQVFKEWLDQTLPKDTFEVLKLSGFRLEDSKEQPVRWDVSFETTGENWLGITIPFVSDAAGEAVVDTRAREWRVQDHYPPNRPPKAIGSRNVAAACSLRKMLRKSAVQTRWKSIDGDEKTEIPKGS